MIIVINENKRLCQDKMWREFAPFGNTKSCVKVYKRLSKAYNVANSQNAWQMYLGMTERVKVAEVPDGYLVNASGDVFDQNDVLTGTLEDHTTSYCNSTLYTTLYSKAKFVDPVEIERRLAQFV